MAESVAERDGARQPYQKGRGDDDDDGAGDSFSELRSLIVGPEQRELMALQAHLLDPSVQTRDVSRVLADAIALRATDPQLTRALAPTIEEAVTASVRRDPRPLADALFPVIGPAIRKAIAHTLASMIDNLNRTVEHSVSWRALQWRWTAFQTRKPFAEIVLLNTLEYRVEQVFLIHAESGLLLQHVSSNPQAGRDADQISAMLTAITDFVRDSFKASSGDTLEALRFGDLTVIAEQGPHAVLAGVVRGHAPPSLRTVFQEAIETTHRLFGPELEAFHGDSSAFERTRPILETCLVTQFREQRGRPSYGRWAVGALVVLLLVGVWAFPRVRDRLRWNAYLDRLRAEPGLVVVSTGRRDGKFFVSGLRDAFASDPTSLIASSALSSDVVEGRWEPYQSLHAPFVLERARDLLRPPSTVALEYRDGVVHATGSAPEQWIVDAERIAPAIAGVRRLEYVGARSEASLTQLIESTVVRFSKGQSRLAPEQAEALRVVRGLLTQLNEQVRVRGRRARIEILGHTDSDGTDQANGPLSQARADVVLTLLRAPALDALDFDARGVGSALPLTSGATDADKESNRRASLRVRIVEPGGQGSERP